MAPKANMISDEEKARIVERVQFENQIRKELAGDEKKEPKRSRWLWLESKLGLLIIAALISGILVPLFQFTQETIKWTRQNRYDNVKYRLEMIRNGMKELTLVHAFVAEAYERTRSFINSETLENKAIDSYRNQMVEMHNRRFVQNAKFAAFLSYFPEKVREAVRESFQQYLSSTQALMMLLDNKVALRQETSQSSAVRKSSTSDFDTALQSLMKEINKNYEEVFRIIRRYLGRLEDESIRYM